MALFAENLTKDPDPDASSDPAEFLFHVRGVGGVGKSTLLAQWREVARRAGGLTALVDEAGVHSVEGTLTALAGQLAEDAGPLKEFDKAIDQYRRTQQAAAERVPEQSTPGTAPSLPARLVTQAALGAASVLPGANVVAAMANPETVAQGTDRIITAVRRRRHTGESEEASLSRAFIGELGLLCDREPRRWVVLFFDTWELTAQYLDVWLRDLLDGAFGELPLDVIIVLAGRDELREREWGTFRPAVVDVPLDVLTEHEARDLLAARGVSDLEVVDAIMRLSMRLPLLLALLAYTNPGAVDDVAGAGTNIVDQAVERFLQWIPEPERREMVLAAALPLRLNRDLFAHVVPDAEPAAWDWLLGQPFVAGQGDFRQYHAVVRASILRQRRTHAPRAWSVNHARLAESHAAARVAVEQHLPGTRRRNDVRWRQHMLDETYHLLCADPTAGLPMALEYTARTAGDSPDALAAWADMLSQAARDSDDAELTHWASRVRAASTAAKPALEILTILTTPGLPSHVRAWALTHRGNTHFLEDRDDEALTDLNLALSINADLVLALVYRGCVHSWNNRPDQALVDLTAALTLDPTSVIALARRGEAHLFATHFEDAKGDFNAALALDPDNDRALAMRGETHRRAGHLIEAVVDLNAALALNPDSVRALVQRGQVHEQAGRLDEAIVDFTAALALDSDNAFAFVQRGKAHRQAGRLDQSIVDFTAGLAIRPDNAWALAERGETHEQAGRLDEAIVDYTAALAINPEYIWALMQRADAHRQAGRLDEAIVDFSAALAHDAENAWALASRGHAYRQAGRFDEAVADLTAALDRDPEYAWAVGVRGQAHFQAGRLDEAVADLTAALDRDPEFAWALGARGQAHFQAGRLDEAVADLTAALNLNRTDLVVLCSLAAVWRHRGELQTARTVLSEAAQLNATEASVLLEEAMLQLLEVGRMQSATAWNAFLEAPYDDPEDLLERATRNLLHGLVVDETPMDTLISIFLAAPGVPGIVAMLRMYVEDLTRMEAPVSHRAEEALRLLA